jgi:hypothetical protein
MPDLVETQTNRDSFHPGELWPDEKGTHINAHGGGLLVDGGVTYWFGEHKTEGEAGNLAQVGVRVYSSTDLYHWKDEGIALAVSEDPRSEITRGCVIERPKVLFNRKTGQYVMWFHLEFKGEGYRSARAGVAVADRPAGPYTYLHALRVNPGIWPENAPESQRRPLSEQEHGWLRDSPGEGGHRLSSSDFANLVMRRDFAVGQMSRDMTLFLDSDGQAYHITASEENRTLLISRLNEDFTGFEGRYARALVGESNEAPAVFKREGKYYLLSSGCTGWAPNPARMAVADQITGPWMPLGNPCRGINPSNHLGPEKSFGGQSTYIHPVPGHEEAFVALFDEWRPDNHSDGRYYWLPIRFEGDRPAIDWMPQWDLSFFSR